MAYVDQTKKKKIQLALQQVIPVGWKWSLSVRHHSTIVLTIWAAPVDILGLHKGYKNSFSGEVRRPEKYTGVNHYHLDTAFDGDLLHTFEKIAAALNTDNFDNSDIHADYFCVGHYVDISVGRWNKPFICTTKEAAHV